MTLTTGSYQVLLDALSRARAGVMTGCSLPDRLDSDEAISVTWHGRARRLNRFDLATSVEGAVTDHPCSPEEIALHEALVRLQLDFGGPFEILSFE